jgi:hypothetical protein
MVERTPTSLASLYEQDETAWLEAMAELVAKRRTKDLDYAHLSEYLSDMAKRDRREVKRRLIGLVAHLLKWDYQPKKRSRSWHLTIVEQQRELQDLLESRTLRNHATAILDKVYQDARKLAVIDTGLKMEKFPDQCPWLVDEVLTRDLGP